MIRWSRKWALVAGAAILAVTNAVALIGAAYNRGGTPESTLLLTERELSVAADRGIRESSGLSLHMRWRVADEVHDEGIYYYYGSSGLAGWLDKAKMAELGFDVSLPDAGGERRSRFSGQLGRDAFIVLELGGDAYEAFRKKVTTEAERLMSSTKPDEKRRGAEMREIVEGGTRLFAIDAGLDVDKLRARFPDRGRYAIVRGQVEPASGRGKASHHGYLAGLHADEINVPLELRGVFGDPGPKARFDATVSFGRRLEPWLVSAQRRP